MKIPALRFALILASAAASRGLAAQDVPTFHAGQWAAEFTGGNFTNEGVMRFFSPRSALVLSGFGALSKSTATPDGGGKETSSSQSLFLALGVRRYANVAAHVLATTELGAGAGFYRSRTKGDVFGNPSLNLQRQANFGIYGEVGAQYFVTSHLALGSVLTVSANGTSGRTENGGTGTDYSGYSLTTALRPIRVTLYF